MHINSGIPNHAFYLAATALGGNAWEAPARSGTTVLTGGQLDRDADFPAFAELTTATARQRHGDGSAEAEAVAGAWTAVGLGGS